jgi:beta-mannanase
LGATIHDDNTYVGPTTGLLETYASMVGRMPAIVNAGGAASLSASFDPNLGNYLLSKGAAFMWTMMPSTSDASVTAGNYDSYFLTFAQAVKAWGHPLYLRFAHEANGNWYPYGTEGSPSGDSPADYVAMWKHVHDIFTSAGATNVRWIWCMNVTGSGMTPYASLYPGDNYVDWVSLDGYNWGSNPGYAWQSFYDVFNTSYQQITALTSKPLMITETASAEQGGSKASWITQGLLTTLPQSFPRIKAVMWFDWSMQCDWLVDSSASSLAAFQSVVASPEYQAPMP